MKNAIFVCSFRFQMNMIHSDIHADRSLRVISILNLEEIPCNVLTVLYIWF